MNLSPIFLYFFISCEEVRLIKNPEVLERILKTDEEIGVERNNYKKKGDLKFIGLKTLKFR